MPLLVIVDDQFTNRRIFSRLAQSIDADLTVRSFGDPAAALEWVRDNTPDLVVTDYKMPQMDGGEFIRRFRELPGAAEVPVIVITIYEERSFRLRALEAGATDFLQSPVDHNEFVTRARNLLKLRKQQLLLERKLEHSERSREEALRDSSERLAQVIDTVPAMVSASDRDGNFIFVNAYQASLTRVDPTLVGESREDALSRDRLDRHRALDRKVFETNAPLPTFEEEIVDSAGGKHVFLTTKSPLRDRANAVVAVPPLRSTSPIASAPRATSSTWRITTR
jgi:CheY-like chemotaxis protein